MTLSINRTLLNILFTVPDFTWQIRKIPSGDIHFNQRIQITCSIGLRLDVFDSILVNNASILDPTGQPIQPGSEGSRIRVSKRSDFFNYEISLEITNLRTVDEGTYTCIGIISPTMNVEYIIINGVASSRVNITLSLSKFFVTVNMYILYSCTLVV